MKPNLDLDVRLNVPTPVVVAFLVLLILKLTGTVSWSWWLVTSPLWLSLGLTVAIIGVRKLARMSDDFTRYL